MSSRIDFEDFVKNGLYLRNWSPRTVRTYRQAWNSFSGFQSPTRKDCEAGLSNVTTCSLTRSALEAWVISLKQKGLTPGGINMYIRTINSFLSWLEEEQQLQVPRLKLLPNPSKPLRGFSDNEIRSLLSFRPKGFFELRTWTLICLLLDTGLRIDEAITALRSKCDLDNLILTVNGKGSKQRQVPLSFNIRKTLFRYMNRQNKDGFLFTTKCGHKLSYRNCYRDIKALCAKAGVVGEHVHPHAFRHCFATTYIRRGGDIYRLSRILGHTSISTTQIYLRSMGIEQIAENHSSLSPLSLRK